MQLMCGERTGESGGWGVTSELLGGWCCAWRVHEDPTHRSGMAMPSRVPRGSPLTCGHASGDHVSEIQWSGGRRLNRHEPGGWVWSCPVGRGLSGRIWRVGQRPGMRDLSHRIVRELVVQRPGMRGGGAVRLVDVGAGAYVAARRDTRTDGPCGVGRRTGHSGGG